MKYLLDYSVSELKDILKEEMGEKPFRAGQIYEWLTKCTPFAEMTNLSLALRKKLSENFSEGYPKMLARQVSSDGTRKYLWEMPRGGSVESVLMRYEHGNSICISTQVGCGMDCAFCASGKGGFIRNLEPGELLAQILMTNADIADGDGKRHITNIVLMGTGEPMANLQNVVKFLRLINSPDSLVISYRNISLSTCGVVPKIYEFADMNIPLTLCLSLHAPTDLQRRQIMPIAKKYSIAETLDAMSYYEKKTGRRIIIEYVLLHGINDRSKDAEALASLLKGKIAHVNLIAYNAISEGGFEGVSRRQAYAFMEQLKKLGVSATLRRSLGQDIDGACGQLRARHA